MLPRALPALQHPVPTSSILPPAASPQSVGRSQPCSAGRILGASLLFQAESSKQPPGAGDRGKPQRCAMSSLRRAYAGCKHNMELLRLCYKKTKKAEAKNAVPIGKGEKKRHIFFLKDIKNYLKQTFHKLQKIIPLIFHTDRF